MTITAWATYRTEQAKSDAVAEDAYTTEESGRLCTTTAVEEAGMTDVLCKASCDARTTQLCQAYAFKTDTSTCYTYAGAAATDVSATATATCWLRTRSPIDTVTLAAKGAKDTAMLNE